MHELISWMFIYIKFTQKNNYGNILYINIFFNNSFYLF
jgi:hypothetical protein